VSQAFTINVTDVNEAPLATNDTNGLDVVIEDIRNLFGIVTVPGDPNATGNALTAPPRAAASAALSLARTAR
jgi:hypothetical protein